MMLAVSSWRNICFIILAFVVAGLAAHISTFVGRRLDQYATPWTVTTTPASDQLPPGEGTAQPQPLVYDLGHHVLPHVDAYWLPDVLVGVSLSLFLWLGPRRRQRLQIYLTAQSWILICRALMILVTIDQASPRCHSQQLQHSDNPGFILNSHCFDLIFSGHTAAGVLLGYFTLQNPRLPGVVRLGVGVLMLSHGLVNVMVGDHYTRDVLLATVIAWLLGSQYQRLMRRLSTGVTE